MTLELVNELRIGLRFEPTSPRFRPRVGHIPGYGELWYCGGNGKPF